MSYANIKSCQKPNDIINLSVTLLLLISLAFFAFFVFQFYKQGIFYHIDLLVNAFISNLQIPILISISKFFAVIISVAPTTIIFIIIIIYLWLKKFYKDALFVLASSSLNGISILLFKNLFHRFRPENMLVNELDFSFPSGHATTAVILFGTILFLVWKYQKSIIKKICYSIILIIFILLVGISRIYLNVHWLSDVIAGFSLGTFLLMLSYLICFKTN